MISINDKIMLIDGNSLLNRAFYALPMLTNAEGQYTNGIYGFLTMLYKVLDQEKPTHIAVAFDRKAPTFRHERYDGYKAKRTGMPDEMASQLPILKEVLDAMNISIFEIDGYEADDVLGTLAKAARQQGMEVVIVTGDRDALQLIEPGIRVIITKKGISEVEEYDEQTIRDKYGINPAQLIDVKGLMGDASDNIPGIPGIGEKTALKLIKQFGSLETILDHMDEISSAKVRNLIEEYKDQAIMSKQLSTIQCNVPIDIDLDKCLYRLPDVKRLKELYERLDFKSLLSHLPQDYKETDEEPVNKSSYSENELDEFLEGLEKVKELCVCYNSALSLSKERRSACKLPTEPDVPAELKLIFSSKDVLKHAYDVKRLIVSMNKKDIAFVGEDFDAMIAAYLLDPSQSNYNMERLIKQYLQEECAGDF